MTVSVVIYVPMLHIVERLVNPIVLVVHQVVLQIRMEQANCPPEVIDILVENMVIDGARAPVRNALYCQYLTDECDADRFTSNPSYK